MKPEVGALVTVREGAFTHPFHVEEMGEHWSRGENLYDQIVELEEGTALVLDVHKHPNTWRFDVKILTSEGTVGWVDWANLVY